MRRSGYGPVATIVGERGERTREQILTVALNQFLLRGSSEVSIQEIAEGVGVSRATFYQYFSGKDQLILELTDLSGTAVGELITTLNGLGPTDEGFVALRQWIEGWADVYDRYLPIFAEWPSVSADGQQGNSLIVGTITALHRQLAAVLKSEGVVALDPMHASILLTNLILRFNFTLHRSGAVRTRTELTYFLTVLAQLLLFPDTPPEATRPRSDEPPEWATRSVSPPADRQRGPGGFETRFGGLSARAAGTVRALMSSALRAVTECGYHRAQVDDIAADAEVTRTTFYRYFDDKLDLLLALSDECCYEFAADARRFGRLGPSVDLDGAQLRRWVRESIALHDRYRAVYRTWIDRSPANKELDAMRRRVVDDMQWALHTALSGLPRCHPIDVRVAHILLVTLMEEVPPGFAVNGLPVDREQQTELFSVMIERALFLQPDRAGSVRLSHVQGAREGRFDLSGDDACLDESPMAQ
ncbi:TetR/AcrR family transcriptional regulator [Rhodococcus sp. SJ-3]|uniref:TetR/AcrR family transcriptional regulator n=1 Tax=Rhodococcus sp. SJ-3 TaxID=3454628 RepID=UPI003F79379E